MTGSQVTVKVRRKAEPESCSQVLGGADCGHRLTSFVDETKVGDKEKVPC